MKEENKIFDSNYKINSPFSNIRSGKDLLGQVYYYGNYICKYGVVECASGINRNYSYFKFVYNGKLNIRTIPKAYSPRGLAIMAGKFVKEVIN